MLVLLWWGVWESFPDWGKGISFGSKLVGTECGSDSGVVGVQRIVLIFYIAI